LHLAAKYLTKTIDLFICIAALLVFDRFGKLKVRRKNPFFSSQKAKHFKAYFSLKCETGRQQRSLGF